MADDPVVTPNPPAPGTPPAEPTTPTTGARTFTQEELGRILSEERRKARDAARAEVEAELRSKQPTPKPTETPKAQSKETDAERIRRLEERIAFGDVARLAEIPIKYESDIFDLYRVQKPEDAVAWARDKVKLFAGGEPAPNPNPAAPPAPQVPEPQPSTPPGSPRTVSPIEQGGLVNIYAMTPLEIDQMPIEELVGHYEKHLESLDRRRGAPRIPEVLRKPRG